MKRRFIFLAVVTFSSSYFIGCEDFGSSKPMVSFVNSGITTGESSQTINISRPYLQLDRAAPGDISIFLETSGDAKVNEDYTMTNPVLIRKGEPGAYLNVEFIDDQLDEPDEIGIVRFSRAEGSSVRFDRVDTTYFVIQDDDVADLVIYLDWNMSGNTSNDNPDFDLYLWRETSPGSGNYQIVATSAHHNYPPGRETIALSGRDKDGRYGISCVYYEPATGDFQALLTLQPSGSAIMQGGTKTFTPFYKAANVNKGAPTIRHLYFTKEEFQYKNFTEFSLPASGS